MRQLARARTAARLRREARRHDSTPTSHNFAYDERCEQHWGNRLTCHGGHLIVATFCVIRTVDRLGKGRPRSTPHGHTNRLGRAPYCWGAYRVFATRLLWGTRQSSALPFMQRRNGPGFGGVLLVAGQRSAASATRRLVAHGDPAQKDARRVGLCRARRASEQRQRSRRGSVHEHEGTLRGDVLGSRRYACSDQCSK